MSHHHRAEPQTQGQQADVTQLDRVPLAHADSSPDYYVVIDDGLSTADLDGIAAVLTAAAVAIADTGTIVLDHTADQGRRALTLVSDVHICVVRENQVVLDVPAATRALHARIEAHPGPDLDQRPELNRIEGVHGPRHLHVIVVGD